MVDPPEVLLPLYGGGDLRFGDRSPRSEVGALPNTGVFGEVVSIDTLETKEKGLCPIRDGAECLTPLGSCECVVWRESTPDLVLRGVSRRLDGGLPSDLEIDVAIDLKIGIWY